MTQHKTGSAYRILILFLITTLGVSGGAMYLGHWLGFRLGSQSLGETAQAYQQMKKEHGDQKSYVSKLEKEILHANEERDVSLRNLKNIRDNFDVLQKREKFLISQRDTFQSMISKDVVKESLQIFDQSITRLPENAYEFAFDVVLLQPKNKPARTITVELTLLDGNAIVRIPLKKYDYEIDGFKRIQGRFIMPKGFKPRKLKFSVNGIGENSIEQYYKWRLGKRIKNMPQSLVDIKPIDNMDFSTPFSFKEEKKTAKK